MLEPIFVFQPYIFLVTFTISGIINWRFPKLQFYLINQKRKIRIHHAILGGLLALGASLIGSIVLLNIGLASMIEDISAHLLKKIKRWGSDLNA